MDFELTLRFEAWECKTCEALDGPRTRAGGCSAAARPSPRSRHGSAGSRRKLRAPEGLNRIKINPVKPKKNNVILTNIKVIRFQEFENSNHTITYKIVW